MKPEDPTEFICKFLHLGKKKHHECSDLPTKKSGGNYIYVFIYLDIRIRDHFYSSIQYI